jgi:hypothetical protein
MVQCVSKPTVNGAQVFAMSPWSLSVPEEIGPATFNPTRPLSPILSPTATPTTAVPALTAPELSPIEIPPKVPPKSSPPKDGNLTPSKPKSKTIKRSPSKSALRPKEQPSAPGSTSSSPRTGSVDRKSPSDGPVQCEQTNESSIDTSVINRGRPVKKSKKSKDLSSEQEPDGWKLPTGIKTLEAAQILPESERDMLRKQACGQVERFEVLRSKHVNTLSKVWISLHALDDC